MLWWFCSLLDPVPVWKKSRLLLTLLSGSVFASLLAMLTDLLMLFLACSIRRMLCIEVSLFSHSRTGLDQLDLDAHWHVLFLSSILGSEAMLILLEALDGAEELSHLESKAVDSLPSFSSDSFFPHPCTSPTSLSPCCSTESKTISSLAPVVFPALLFRLRVRCSDIACSTSAVCPTRLRQLSPKHGCTRLSVPGKGNATKAGMNSFPFRAKKLSSS